MIDRVAEHVHQRVFDFFQNALIDGDFAALDLKINLFAQAARQVAHQTREQAENLRKRQ